MRLERQKNATCLGKLRLALPSFYLSIKLLGEEALTAKLSRGNVMALLSCLQVVQSSRVAVLRGWIFSEAVAFP